MRKLIIILFLFIGFSVFSQTFKAIKQFDTSTGLPSDVVYAVTQDNKGYIWITTDNGLVKFNGTSYKLFQIPEGLPSNDIFNIVVDSKNRIWLTGFHSGLCYIENDKVKLVKNSQDLSGITYSFEKDGVMFFKIFYNSKTYFVDKSNRLQRYISKVSKGIELIDYKKKTETFIGINQVTRQYCILDKNEKIISYAPKDLVYSKNLIDGEEPAFLVDFSVRKPYVPIRNVSNGIKIFANNKFLDYKKREISSKLQWLNNEFDQKYRIYKFNDKDFFISKNGIYDPVLSEKINNFPCDKSSLFTVFIDNKENFWLVFSNNKLMFIPANYDIITNFNISSLLNNEIESIKKSILIDNNLFFITSKNNFYKYDFNNKKLKFIKKYDNKYPYKIFNTDKSIIVACAEGFDYFTKNNLNLLSHQKFISSNTNRNSSDYNGNLYYVMSSRIYDSNNKKLFLDKTIRFNSIFVKNNNEILVSNEDKIGLYNVATGVYLSNDDIKSISTLGVLQKTIIAGTNSKGLYVLDNKLKILNKFLPNENIYEINTDEKTSSVFVGTNKGLHIYSLKNDVLRHIRTVSPNEGLVYGKINSIDFNKDKIFITTQNGFSAINRFGIKTKIVGSIEIDKLYCNDSLIKETKSLNFKRNENNITVVTSLFTFNNNANFKTFYSLSKDNESDKWLSFSESKIAFKSLPPGKYVLKLYARPIDSGIITDSKTLVFNIEPYFWETTLFKVVIVFVLSLLVVFLLFYLKRKTERKFRLKLKLNTLELKVLKAQMNPHFIFNALNTFQSIYFIEGEIKANNYLNKFSKLIRNTLDLVNKDNVTIADEINYIKSYLELEQIKSKNEINVIFNIDESLNETIIPVMLIQPVVENAIIHGLLPKIKNKTLKIDVLNKDADTIQIIIEDNGVGFKDKVANKDNNHKSYATSIIKDRIKILNDIEKLNYKIVTYNLAEIGEGSGVKVVIEVPNKKQAF
ncbi:MAG: histidine kinase [Bacteroidota bacterium]